MIQVIPARIEGGRVVPEVALPAGVEGRSVSVLIEGPEPTTREDRESALARLVGLLKGVDLGTDDAYQTYLTEKYR